MCAARIRFEKEDVLFYIIYIYMRTDLYEHCSLEQFTHCVGKFLEFDNA